MSRRVVFLRSSGFGGSNRVIRQMFKFAAGFRWQRLRRGKMEKSLLFKKLVSSSLRKFSTSSVCNGKRNFRQLALYNFRGSREFRAKREKLSKIDPDIPFYTYGVRKPGYTTEDDEFVLVPEMIPELIVPDLTDFKLKPYVSYRTSDIVQSEFTAKDLFDAIYSKKIKIDFASGELDENGNPSEPNTYERLTPEEATTKARKTGSDIF